MADLWWISVTLIILWLLNVYQGRHPFDSGGSKKK